MPKTSKYQTPLESWAKLLSFYFQTIISKLKVTTASSKHKQLGTSTSQQHKQYIILQAFSVILRAWLEHILIVICNLNTATKCPVRGWWLVDTIAKIKNHQFGECEAKKKKKEKKEKRKHLIGKTWNFGILMSNLGPLSVNLLVTLWQSSLIGESRAPRSGRSQNKRRAL